MRAAARSRNPRRPSGAFCTAAVRDCRDAVEVRSGRRALRPSGASRRAGLPALSLAERIHALGARRVARRARHAGDFVRPAAPRTGLRGRLAEGRARLLEQGARRDARRAAGVPTRTPVLGAALAFLDAPGPVGDAALRRNAARRVPRTCPLPCGRAFRGFSSTRRERGVRAPVRDAAFRLRPASLFARARGGVPLRRLGRALFPGRSLALVPPRLRCGRAPRSRRDLGVPGGGTGRCARPLRGHSRAPATSRPRGRRCSPRRPSRRVRSRLLRGSFRGVLRSRARASLPVACVGRPLRHLSAVSGNRASPARGPVEGPSRLLAVSPVVARSVSLVPLRLAPREPPRARARPSLAPPSLCGLPELARRLHGGAEVSRRGAAVPRFPVCILRGGISREHARRGLDARRLRDDPRVSVCPSRVCVALGLVRGVFLRKGTDGTECAASLRAGGGALRPAGDRVLCCVFLPRRKEGREDFLRREQGKKSTREREVEGGACICLWRGRLRSPRYSPFQANFVSLRFSCPPARIYRRCLLRPERHARGGDRPDGLPAAASPCPARAGARAPPAALAIQAGVTLTEGDAPWRGQGRRGGPRSRARAGRTTGGT